MCKFLFSLIVLLQQFLCGVGQILGQVPQVPEPAELVSDDRSFRHPVDIQNGFDQSIGSIFLKIVFIFVTNLWEF